MLVVLRPQPGLAATLDAARGRGLEAAGHALSRIVPVAWDAPDPADIDGLLIGSANVFVHGGTRLAAFQSKPAFVVGKATADAARSAGFNVALQGAGGLQKVLDTIPAPTRLLRIAGEEHLALEVPPRITITTRIAYRSQLSPLDPALPALRADRPLVLLHSAASARHFAQECERLGLDRGQICLAALGPRIAAAAGNGWRAVHIAPQPNDAALLEMARNMCDET